MKTNIEVIEDLVAYFKEHADFETVARCLANCMIDLNRFLSIDSLPIEESDCLIARTQKNVKELHNFVRNGNKEKLRLKNVLTKEEADKE